MAIYGTALLSICLLIGLLVGQFLGTLLGVGANVGGVGIAMLLLILVCESLQRSGRMLPPSQRGITFWSSIYIGGITTGGTRGIADIEILSGVGLMGGAMLRDLAIVATAFGVRMDEFRKTGLAGILSLCVGVCVSFLVGASVAYAFGYRDAVSMTTIGGGAATYIVGPVTGSALAASSEVMALSVAVGLVKSILVMTTTPFVAKYIGLDNPRSALIFGGLLGTTSGVAGGLAATDPQLVPYGAMSATFYTGLGCLLGPSVLYILIRAFV
jgi:malonate transporter MadM subunit